MKITTLKAIEELLQNDVKVKGKALEMVTDKVKRLYQDEANEVEGFDPKNLEFWKESKSRYTEKLWKAEAALEDFLNHEWT